MDYSSTYLMIMQTTFCLIMIAIVFSITLLMIMDNSKVFKNSKRATIIVLIICILINTWIAKQIDTELKYQQNINIKQTKQKR